MKIPKLIRYFCTSAPLASAFACLFAARAQAQLIMPPATTEAGLKGPVKLVETSQGEAGAEPEIFVRTEYDRHGYEVRKEYPPFAEATEIYYAFPGVQSGEKRFTNGELESEYTIELNDAGEPLSATRVTKGEGVTSTEKYSATHIPDGRYTISSRQEFGPSSILSPVNSEIVFSEPGGRVLSISMRRANGTSNRMEFDETGKVCLIRDVKVNDTTLTEIERSGDFERSYISRISNDPGSSEENESRHLTTKIEKDTQGNPLTVIHYTPDGTVTDCITFRYTYDRHGNWTRCETSGGSEGPKLYLRRIEYFE